ncbi:CoA ester lyase [Paenarthrobacter ilicis]|uniref:HpcH/HpaI aldolase/citrate lyase family protein n=1 Tax=Paenarthrobacter ilicis TaxID=43665 RepID=UPI0028D62E39|nr:CoA ester lyase [Paenarthrobacter ilicis]
MSSWTKLQQARSFLFVPGDRPGRFRTAQESGADVVVLDLEDAVSVQNRDVALQEVTAWLSTSGQAVVRIRAGQDPAPLKDLHGLLGVMVPKAEHPEQVTSVHEALGCPVIALVESAVGVLASTSLASAYGVVRLAFGELDLAADIGAQPNQRAMLMARSALVLASGAGGLPGPVDGVTPKFDDDAALARDLHAGMELGMTGKLLIHPRQVAIVHDTFHPGDDDVAWARRVVGSMNGGGGVAKVDGAMVDAPVLRRAHAMLDRFTSGAHALATKEEEGSA